MNTEFGTQIGRKFHADGTAARYPGNTVIADVRPGNPAYDVMTACLRMLEEVNVDRLFIRLPEDSYHMTVIRGVNDLVREAEYWPAVLDPHATMTAVDAYMRSAVESVENPGKIHMKFDCAVITPEDFRIRLVPKDAEQDKILRRYRDAVADAVGLRLPGHDTYTYHMTLAYTWYLPRGKVKDSLSALVERMNDLLAKQEEVVIDPPHFAWYQDMLSFSDKPIIRE